MLSKAKETLTIEERGSKGPVRVSVVLVAAIALLLVAGLPSAARATHDGSGYWFFQNYLERPDGTRTVTHVAGGSQCCSWVVVRMSWEAWTHDMNFHLHHLGRKLARLQRAVRGASERVGHHPGESRVRLPLRRLPESCVVRVVPPDLDQLPCPKLALGDICAASRS
jgi:hypothetical protein